MKCRYCYGELDTALRCIVCGKDNQPLFSDSSKNAFEQNSDRPIIIDPNIYQAPAMIEAYAKQVPEKLLSIIYNMPPEFYSDWLDHTKEICQDFGYTVKE